MNSLTNYDNTEGSDFTHEKKVKRLKLVVISLSFVLLVGAISGLIWFLTLSSCERLSWDHKPDGSIPPDEPTPGSRKHWWDSFCRNQAVKDNDEFDLVFAGDSITERMNIESNKQVLDDVFSSFSSKGAMGISGDETQQLLFRMQYNEFNFERMAKLIVHIGINNLLKGDDANETALGIFQVLDEFAAMEAVTDLYWLPLLPTDPDDLELMERIQAVNDQISNWIKDTKIAVEVQCSFSTFYNQPQLFIGDFTHPNADGYVRWFPCILENIVNDRHM